MSAPADHPATTSPHWAALALHTWTVDALPLDRALAVAREAGFQGLELRRVDFTRAHASGLDDADCIALVRAGGLPVVLLGVEPGWIFAEGAEARRLWEVFRTTCHNAVALGCPTLMSASGPLSGTVRQAIAAMRIAGDIAGEHGLRLAFEFNSQHAVLNNPEIVREILAGAGRRNCGLLLDTYHLHRAGRPGAGFADIGGEEIVAVQFSDVPPDAASGPPTERLAPGDGEVAWLPFLQLLWDKGYRGYLSYEAPSSRVVAAALPASTARARRHMQALLGEVRRD